MSVWGGCSCGVQAFCCHSCREGILNALQGHRVHRWSAAWMFWRIPKKWQLFGSLIRQTAHTQMQVVSSQITQPCLGFAGGVTKSCWGMVLFLCSTYVPGMGPWFHRGGFTDIFKTKYLLIQISTEVRATLISPTMCLSVLELGQVFLYFDCVTLLFSLSSSCFHFWDSF